MNTVKGFVLLDGGYMGPFQKTFDEVKEETYGFLNNYVFNSWDHFLDEERKTAQLWNKYVESACRSSMMKKGDKIVLRVDPESALQADLLLNKFSPLQIPKSNKPALLLRATLPEEANDEREKGVRNLSQRLTNLHVLDVPNSWHDVLWCHPNFVTSSNWSFISKEIT